MPNFQRPKKQTKRGFVMNMGFNSKDSDTTFKAKDQANIKAGPGKYSKYPLDNAIIGGAVKVFKGFGKLRGSGSSSPVPKSTASTPKTPSAPAKPVASTPASAPKKPVAPKPYVKKGGKATGSIKNYAIGSEARRKEYDARGWAYDSTIKKPKAAKSVASAIKSKPVSIATPKPTASTSIPTAKPKATVSTPKAKSSKIREKGEIALATGNVKKAQRLRKRYDRIKKRENKKAGIADAYKVNL